MKKIALLLICLLAVLGCEKMPELKLQSNDDDCECQYSSNKSSETLKSDFIGPIHWHKISQEQRNQTIIKRAYKDNNGPSTRLNCKEWAQKVVLDASGNCVTIPSTKNNNWEWDTTNSFKYVQKSGAIDKAQPGDLIQMRLRDGSPHTAIISKIEILDKNNTRTVNITLIESNWCKPQICETVKERKITEVDFNNSIQAYTIYKIL